MQEKREEQLIEVLDGIENQYLISAMELLKKDNPQKKDHNWIGIALAVAAVLALIIAGTMNILHHQNGDDFPVQTGGSQDVSEETESGSIDVSGNHAEKTDTPEGDEASTNSEGEETANGQKQNWQSELMYAFYNGKLYGYDGSSWRSEVPSDAQLVGEGKIVHGQPEHELEVSGVPEGVKVYFSYNYDYVYLSTGYECFLLEEKKENSRVRSYRYRYDSLPENIKKDYPLPDEKQMKQWGEQVKNYDLDEEAEWPFFEEDLCWILNYFDVVGRGEQKLYVMLDMELSQAEKLTGAQLTEIAIRDVHSGIKEGKKGCYGYVPANTLLRMMNEGYSTQIFLLHDWERLPLGEYNMGSTAVLNAGLVYHVLFYQYNGMSVFWRDETGKECILIREEYGE